jgi:hypothetical protein
MSLIDLADDNIDYPLRVFAYPDPHERANDSLVVCRHCLDFRAVPPADRVTETPQSSASRCSRSPRALPPRIRAGSHCHYIVSLATLSYFMLLLGYSVHRLRLPVFVLSLLFLVAEFPPILIVFWVVLFFRMEMQILAGHFGMMIRNYVWQGIVIFMHVMLWTAGLFMFRCQMLT